MASPDNPSPGIVTYSYSVTNDLTQPISELLIPGFGSQGGVTGTLAPAGWLVTVESTAATPCSYDPSSDPDASTYALPAWAFVAPDFVVRFRVDTAAVDAAEQALAAAIAARDQVQQDIDATQALLDQAITDRDAKALEAAAAQA